MSDLSKSADSVQRNIDTYWKTACAHPDLIKDAARVKQWKAYRTEDGEWRFGPSRFVGYEGMTPKKYVKRKKMGPEGGLNGTETEKHLKQWTEDVRRNSKLHHQLLDALADFLSEAGAKVGIGASFSVMMVEGSSEFLDTSDPDRDDIEVEALVTLSKRLTVAQLEKLIRRLNALSS
ncbi:hypothetical protein [Pararhodobacter oceanensis]|uniref:hypothetical protein n=1 Tax=Pararhodobacter oceanensis TaxID=2172121 RepID=UPI003A93A484